MLVEKVGSKLIFNNEGSILEYDFKDKSYTKNGRINKKPQSYFRGLSVRDFAEGCDEKYSKFIKRVFEAEKTCSNIGTILERIPMYSKLESWMMVGYENFYSTHIIYHVSAFNKYIHNYLKKYNLQIDNTFLGRVYNSREFDNTLRYFVDEDIDRNVAKRFFDIVQYRNQEFSTLINLGYNDIALIRYLINIHNFEAFNMYNAISDLKDYAVMSKAMSRNGKFEKYPRYLKTTHDIIVRNYNNYKTEHNEEIFGKMVDLDLEYKYKDYSIVVPKTTKELKDEGVSLSHCVGSYVDSIIEGKRQVCFLRKSEELDKSLITLDVKNGQIQQAEGFMRRKPNSDEKMFIEKFAKVKNLKILQGVI